ncbi:MAG: hypothetical protein ACFFEE_02380 [Candidatus Thorarchaeota archaeon]
MRRALVLLVVGILLYAIPAGNSSTTFNVIETHTPSQEQISIQRSWTCNIVVVGYDQSLINENILLQDMPLSRNYWTEDVEIEYSIQYEVSYADEVYLNGMRQVMLDNSENGTGTGTTLNEGALLYQQNNPDEPQRIFYPRDGRVIDAYAVEDWIEENPFVPKPDLGYTLYLVNFSEFDSQDHSLEHWYDYHPRDADTGEDQDWFRLEWDNALNPNVTMDYPFFGGRYNTFIVDPSAHQWYLKWCRIWWSAEIFTEYDFWTQDLEDKMSSLDMGVPADVDALNAYLQECIWDPINQLFFPYQHQPANYVESGTFKGLVFCMDVADGVSVDSLRWITNADLQKGHLEELYPFIDWTVDIEFLDIDNESDWTFLFWNYAEVEPDGTTIAEGYPMFNAIYDFMKPQYIEADDNINVFGVVFIKKQMEMHTPIGTYTGLGGDGQTVVWKSWERYYRPDEVTPKDGISIVQLHETMHAIGFHHTWQHERYSSDFSWGPMGYFAIHNGTSSFDKNWVQGTYLDQMEALLHEELLVEQEELTVSERPETYLAEQRAEEAFINARAYYNEMDWLAAYNALSDARDWTRRMNYSQLDTTPPTIHSWGTIPESIGNDGFLFWAEVTDDLSGIENVTLYAEVSGGDIHLFPCTFSDSNWSTTVGPLVSISNLWIVAYDWGMNRVELQLGGNFVLEVVIPAVAIVGAASAVIGVGVYAMKRKE